MRDSDVPVARTASMQESNVPMGRDAPTGPVLPPRHFDGYAWLSSFKTLLDIAAIYVLADNDFSSGAVVAAIGLVLAVFLRVIGNNFLGEALLRSNVETRAWSLKALTNTFLGTRLGYRGLSDLGALQGSELLRLGPRTLQAIAEVIQQGFLFFPLLVLFLQFGFGGSVEKVEIVLIAGLVNYAQILCWVVSPLQNVTSGYLWFFFWFAFTVPFLLVLLFSVAFEEFIPDTFYTRKEVYAWLKTATVVCLGIVGLSVQGTNMSRMLNDSQYRMSGPPSLLYFMRFSSLAVLGFEVVSLLILLIDQEVFLFDDEDVVRVVEIDRLKAIVVANTVFAGWIMVVSYQELITYTGKMDDLDKQDRAITN